MFRRRFLTRLTRLGLATYIMTYCMAFTVCAAENPIADLAVADSVQMVQEQEDEQVIETLPDVPEASEQIIGETEDEGEGDEFLADTADSQEAEEAEEEDEDTLQETEVSSFAFSTDKMTITSAGKQTIRLSVDYTGDTPENIQYSLRDAPDGVTVEETDTGFGADLFVPSNCPECSFHVDARYGEYPASCLVKVYIAPSGIVPFINDTSVSGNNAVENAISITDISKTVQIKITGASEDDSVLVENRTFWKAFVVDNDQGTVSADSSDVAVEKIGNDTCNVKFSETSLGKTFKIQAGYNNSYTDVEGVENEKLPCSADVYFNVTGEPEDDYYYNITTLSMSQENITVSKDTVGSSNAVTVEIGAVENTDGRFTPDKLDPTKLVYGLIEHDETDLSKVYNTLYGLNVSQSSTDPYEFGIWALDTVDIQKAVDFIVLYYNEDEIGDENAQPVIARVEIIDGFEHAPQYWYNITELYVTPSSINATTKDPQTVVIDYASDGENTVEPNKLDPTKIVWKLINKGNTNLQNCRDELFGVKILQVGTEAEVLLDNVTGSVTVDVVALYYNNESLNDTSSSDIIIGICDLNVSIPIPIEAHVVGNALKVQVYNNKNTLPLTVRATNESAGAVSYEVKSVSFTNTSIPKYVVPSVVDDGKTINVNINKTYMQYADDSYWTTLIKEKFKTGFDVTVTIDGEEKTLTTENVTVSFGNDKPTVKMITQESPVVIDYYNETITPIKLSGLNISKIISAETSTSETSKGIYLEHGEFHIISGGKLPKKLAKGTYKATVTVVSDENYNLPDFFLNLTVPITYTVVDGTPDLIMLNKTTTVLNPALGEEDELWFKVDKPSDETDIEYALYDSKNKKIDLDGSEPIGIDFDYDEGDRYGYITVNATEYAQYGQSYKIKLYVINTETGKTGPEKVITVKTAAATASDPKNMGITIKGKGSIDASVPGSYVALTVAGKNLNLLDKDVRFKVYVNGSDITSECLDTDYDEETGTLYVYENTSRTFSLLNKGYALQQAEFTVFVEDVNVTGPKGNFSGLTFNATYKTKILASAVTPKLGVSKVTVNPAYDTVPIAIPITNLEGGIYDYDVICLNTTKATTPFRPINVSYDDENDIDVIYIGYSKSGVNATAGQSFKVNITPVAPVGINKPLNGKTASMTIAILDPTKAAGKVSATSKITGSIDAIRNTTNITAALTFKNLYDPLAVVENIECTISQKVKGNITDCTDNFTIVRNGTVITIARKPDRTLDAGTYDAQFNATVKKADGTKDTVLVTSKIKVVRGTGTGSAFTPASVQLINLDYTTSAYTNITLKDDKVNDIRFISMDSTYETMFDFSADSSGECIISMKEGYAEYKNKKTGALITTAVTKTVPVDVYYAGSAVPDKLKLKVVINP